MDEPCEQRESVNENRNKNEFRIRKRYTIRKEDLESLTLTEPVWSKEGLRETESNLLTDLV